MMGDGKLLKQMGQRISSRRKSLKYTQEELAERVGVSTQMISNLELGKKAIRPENLVKLCDALGISADYILMGAKKNDTVDELYDKLMQLSSEERQLVYTLVEYMTTKDGTR